MLVRCSWRRFVMKRLLKKLLVMQRNREHNQPSDELLMKERATYHLLATKYAHVEFKKRFPFAREAKLACYRAAAMLDDVQAQFLLGKLLLDEAHVRAGWEAGHVLSSQSNQRALQCLYEDVHAYLLAAEKQGHIEAQRLRGLCFINGWGVVEDKQTGFELVMASIQRENSWDRVPQIFATMGLNKPEFFSALTQFRQKSS